MDSRTLARLCREIADSKKAENLEILDVRKLTSIADYFVIATGSGEPHLRAIENEIADRLREEHDIRPNAIDGTLQTSWMVLDYSSVIVHIMRADARERYNLEALWGDAPRVKPRKRKAPAKTAA